MEDGVVEQIQIRFGLDVLFDEIFGIEHASPQFIVLKMHQNCLFLSDKSKRKILFYILRCFEML